MRRFSWWLPAALIAQAILFSGCSGSGGDDDDRNAADFSDDDAGDDDDAAADDDADDDDDDAADDDDDAVDDDVDDDGDDDAADDDDTETDDDADDDTMIDDDTDDDAVDDDADDDTEPFGTAPQLRVTMRLLSAADPDLEYWDEWAGTTWNPEWERFAMWAGWYDADGDLAGGSLFVRMDGQEAVEFPLPNNLPQQGGWNLRKVGVEFTGDLALPGTYTGRMWVRDRGHNDSPPKPISYTVGETQYGIGAPFTNFTLRGFHRTAADESTGEFSDYTLSDYAGRIILIDSFAGWCPPCDDEAGELDSLANLYPDDLTIFSLMYENYGGGAPSDQNLEDWTLYHYGTASEGVRAVPLEGVILNDGGTNYAMPYWLANYVPDNFVLDRNHVVRFKMSGWSRTQVLSVINHLRTE